MKRFRNILYVYNSDPAHRPVLQHVMSLVERSGAKLTLVEVVDDLRREMNLIPSEIDLDTFSKTIFEDRREQITNEVMPLSKSELDIEVKILAGNPALEIIREVIREGHDLVVKSATGFATGIGGRLFGSLAIKLMRKCPCPVWIIKPAGTIGFHRVLAAVDPTLKEGGDDRLNHTILSLAASIAKSQAAKLDIIHCWRVYGETLLSSGRTRMAENEFQSLMTNSEKIRSRKFNELVAAHDLSQVRYEAHLQKGFPEMIIPSFVEVMEVDLIVMGTVSRSGIAGWITGNTAEKVLGIANCSVLTVKPPDFVSPIQA